MDPQGRQLLNTNGVSRFGVAWCRRAQEKFSDLTSVTVKRVADRFSSLTLDGAQAQTLCAAALVFSTDSSFCCVSILWTCESNRLEIPQCFTQQGRATRGGLCPCCGINSGLPTVIGMGPELLYTLQLLASCFQSHQRLKRQQQHHHLLHSASVIAKYFMGEKLAPCC